LLMIASSEESTMEAKSAKRASVDKIIGV